MSELTPMTQVAILLTARWSVNGAKPLTNSEYGDFRRWLGTTRENAIALLSGSCDLSGCPIDEARLQGLLGRGLGVFQPLDRWQRAGLWVKSWSDDDYPIRFKQLKHRAPVVLFGYGNPNAFSSRALAVVGSRNASEERLNKAAEIGRACAREQITVVSGGARGVDTYVMSAGMTEQGTVVGVLADSLLKESGKKIYRDAILERRLCLMSEVNPEARFDVGNAMARNRLAYACADAALIVDCDPGKGGTWQGAMEALREGKAVYVIRGAKAERELAALGAIVTDMDFALHPGKLIAGERPPHYERVASKTESVLRDLFAAIGNEVSDVSAHLRQNSDVVAAALVHAAMADGLVTTTNALGSIIEPMALGKRGRKKAPKSNTNLFADLDRGARKE